ncbi:N-6 DNA methylase [Methanoregula sp.]|uniref:Eco57I restriction-modification methylase domain-containing protein n=1 Tax=Methanoregula sp. TaxID=2052170 RepID=UPI00236F05C7|nr:N-6 DNA methylase [Methanoregula sp.]MDD1686831.1 Eco57I restriction-modification methylase domain-containing protein [Methanoregula sp.]
MKTLGWDVYNKQGWSEKAREVSVEQPIKISGTTDFIDYSFKIGRDLVFIAEAKAPKVRIKDNLKAALQVRSYAWNAKLPLCILTNFDEFAIYDCTKKPSPSDPAGYARIEYFTYRELPAKWEDIVRRFSKDAVFNGSFDEFAKTTKGKKGTASVDEAFLNEIEEWRKSLAQNIMLRNRDPPPNVDELNFAVQVIIDRIIFLQNCEDRGLEPYGTLKAILDSDNVYTRLCELFRTADSKYNSGIFHFNKESDREEPDVITPKLKIDDKILKVIIHELSEGPYEFSVIPPAILGQVYEQFLGKVIRITDGLNAKVDDKPEVKKAGGVFYTPQYIVEYIVKHTVRELVEGKTPREVAKIRILDPACGSGSFLLGAYQSLLDWHLEWYIQNLAPLLNTKVPITDSRIQELLPEPLPRKKKDLNSVELPIYRTGYNEGINKLDRTKSDWALSTSEKKRILIKNIFGVDIDRQAVEVTKLSLLLKVLEGEKEENLDKQLKISDERALPSLDKNIKCGNSLIGTDILTPELSQEDVRRINPFDWDREFPDIMLAGGFDAVIGNPPYVRQEGLKESKKYFETHYKVYQGTADLYTYFFERGIALLRPKGFFSIIVANKWTRANYGKPLRKFLLTKQIEEIIDFGDLPVFETATTYPLIIRVLNDSPKREFYVVPVKSLNFSNLDEYVVTNYHTIKQDSLTSEGWSLGNEAVEKLLKRVTTFGTVLSDYLGNEVHYGIKTGLNKAFVIDEITRANLIKEDPKSSEIIKPFVIGKDIKRYSLPDNRGKYLLFTRHGIDIKQYPAIHNYLKQFKNELMPKPKEWAGEEWNGRKPGSYQWYEIQDRVDYYQEFEKPKILYLVFQVKPAFTLDLTGNIYANNAVWIIPRNDLYLLGLLNSKMGWFLTSHYCTQIQGGFQLMFQYFGRIPIRTINFSDSADKTRHDRMVSLVTTMLDLNKKHQDAKLDQEKTLLQRQIEATDAAIDILVYELYELTDEEIGIVEGK